VVTWKFPDNKSFEQGAADMAEAFGGTAELWESYMTFFSNMSADFRLNWEKSDYDNMGERFAETAD
jgi:hypothetical protein